MIGDEDNINYGKYNLIWFWNNFRDERAWA